ncbi:MAG: heavy metal translocating P-type ATPase [Pseudomonadota bacterium]
MTAACAEYAAAPTAIAGETPERRPVALSVPGMKCAACMQSVERALNCLPGVSEAQANLTMKRVHATTDCPPGQLVEALKDAGFDAYPYDAARTRGDDDRVLNDLLLRLGVAGFAMMNVMLLSVAVWSGASDATRDMFHLISGAIALPSTIYAARPFFQKALSALRAGRLNMDVPISLAILLASGMSLYETLNSGAHAYFDAALSLTFFLLIGRVLEHQTKAAARSAAEDLTALEVQTVRRKTDDGYQDTPTSELKVGDIVLVATGMRAPVDGACLDDEALTDRSFLTGESEAVLSKQGDVLRAGEINLGAPIHIQATAVGEDTSLRQIAALVETAENGRGAYSSLADRAARIYAPAVHLLALATFLGWLSVTGDTRHALNIAIAVLIITCPCALGLAVPAVATATIGRLFGLGFLVKSGDAIERLAEVDAVLLDKTGTLTDPGAQCDALTPHQRSLVRALAEQSAHPISRVLAMRLADAEPAKLTRVKELPGRGVEALSERTTVALGSGEWLGAPSERLVLKDGDRITPLSQDETIRPGAMDLPVALRSEGLETVIVSGDVPERTIRLANMLGVDASHGGASPEEKHALIARMRAEGKRPAMIGDGVNDAAALAAAHVSLAPGGALDAARNAADIIILAPTLERVPQLLRLARLAVRLSRQNFAIAAAYNAVAIPVAVAGYATPMLAAIAMSASSLTVLLNAMRVRIAT